MGDKKTKTTSSSNSTQNLTQTANNPGYVDQALANLTGQVQNLSSLNPTSLIAGPDPLQTQAATGAAGLSLSPDFGTASQMLSGAGGGGPNTYAATTGTAASLLPNLQNYFSPYQNDVVKSALADYDVGAGQTRAANQLALAGDDTFGGSGGAIQTSLSNDAIDRGRATLSAGLLNQGFNEAASLSNQDADRQQQMSLANLTALNSAGQYNAGAADTAAQRQLAAGAALTNNGTAAGAQAQGNVATQSSIGQILQALAQAKAGAPLAQTGALASILAALPLGLVHGQTTNGASSSSGTSTQTVSDPMGQIGSLISAGGSLASGLGAMGVKI